MIGGNCYHGRGVNSKTKVIATITNMVNWLSKPFFIYKFTTYYNFIKTDCKACENKYIFN